MLLNFKKNDGYIYIYISCCLCNHSHYFQDEIFFILTLKSVRVISSTSNLTQGSERASIKPIKSYVVENQKFNNPMFFIL